MNNAGFFDSIGIYAAEFQVAFVRSRSVILMVALGWVVFPFILQLLAFPSDMIRLHAFLQGLPIPAVFTVQQRAAGFVETLFVLAAFIAFQFIATVLFYRRAKVHGAGVARPGLWPVAAVSVGLVGNAIWFIALGGVFDFEGCVMGLLPAGLSIAIELFLEKLGRDFVFGNATGFHPA